MYPKCIRSFVVIAVAMSALFVMTGNVIGAPQIWKWTGPVSPGPGAEDPPPGPNWQVQTQPVTVILDCGDRAWFAIENEYSVARKTWWIEMSYTVDLPPYIFYSAIGYTNGPVPHEVNTSPQEPYWSDESAFPYIRVYPFLSNPRPDWEVVQIGPPCKGGMQATALITANFTSYFLADPPSGPCVNVDSLIYGMPGDSGRLTEVWIFNTDTPIDTGATPAIVAPMGSGTWSYEFVQEDPMGDPRPLGGVHWYTDGFGIESGQLFELEFCLNGSTQQDYTLHLYDAARDEYYKIAIPVNVSTESIPTLTEWGLIIFAVLLAGWMAWMVLRRRRRPAIHIA